MPYLTMAERRREIEDAMRRAGGDTAVAARLLGLSTATFYQRTRRAGIDLRVMAHGIREAAIDGAVVEADGAVVRLTIADYAILQARAADGLMAAALQRELATANHIIDVLTAKLQGVAA